MEVVIQTPPRSRPAPAPKRSFFDFVVANRPIYIPGSGHPPPKPTLMPIHDKCGIILRKIPIDGGMVRYIVTYEDQPYLKISVDELHVLDYVSARTYENWNHEEYLEVLRQESEDSRTKAKNERMRQEEEGEKPARSKQRRKKTFGKRTKTTATKGLMGPPSMPVRRRTSEVEIEERPAFKSPQRPTHLSPNSKQRGLAETVHDSESEEEEEFDQTQNIQAELDRQFENDIISEKYDFDDGSNHQPQGFEVNPKPRTGPSRLAQHNASSASSSSPSSSPEPIPRSLTKTEPPPILPPRSKRDTSSRPSTSSSTNSNPTTARSKRQRTSASATASISSLEAGRTYDRLSQNDPSSSTPQKPTPKPKIGSIHSRYTSSSGSHSQSQSYSQIKPNSIFNTKPPVTSSAPLRPSSPSSSSASSSSRSDQEYEVESILSSKYMLDKNQNPMQVFLIKWAGYPESEATWESEDNVGHELIASYNASQSRERKSVVDIALSPEKAEERGGAVGNTGKGKGKKAIPGDTGDEESLFLPGPALGRGSKKSPYFVEEMSESEARPGSRGSGRSSRGSTKVVSFSAKEDVVMD